MANQWLRLWHDMPTDPKWRTIAKASGQRIGDVMSVYLHLMVCGSNATERGRTQSFNAEDVASALDLETEQVTAITAAMQGRVLDGDTLTGWEKRQVMREDDSAGRAKAWREAQKALKEQAERDANAGERKRTPDKDKDTDKDTEDIGKRGKPRTKVPEDFKPDEAGIAALKGLPVAEQVAAFIDHHKGKGSLMADWQATFRTWARNAVKWASAEDKKRMTVEGTKERDPELVRIEQDAKKATGVPDAIRELSQRIKVPKGAAHTGAAA